MARLRVPFLVLVHGRLPSLFRSPSPALRQPYFGATLNRNFAIASELLKKEWVQPLGM